MNERPESASRPEAGNDRNWVLSDAGAYEPPFGFRGLGAGSSAAVMRSSSPSHSAFSHRSAEMSICGFAPGYGGTSDTGSAWARPDAVGFTNS